MLNPENGASECFSKGQAMDLLEIFQADLSAHLETSHPDNEESRSRMVHPHLDYPQLDYPQLDYPHLD